MRFLCVFLLLTSLNVHAQLKTLQQYVQTLDSFYRLTPVEKVFIHTDRNYYLPGENIWFKAYVTVDDDFLELSKVLYVDVCDLSGKIIAKSQWPIRKNNSFGNLYLPTSILEGNYVLRAYTLYMLNQPHLIDEKLISVAAKNTQNNLNSENLSVQFYPEGGYLVNGVKSKMAYKIIGNHYQNKDELKITVIDNENDTLYTGKSIYQGMGYFFITPVKGKSYRLHVNGKNLAFEKALPAAIPNGLTIEVLNNHPNKIFLSLKTESPDLYNTVLVTAHINGVNIYAQNYNLSEGFQGGAISKNNLPNGVVTISCFSETMQLLGQRSVYIQKYVHPILELDVKQLNISQKDKISLLLKGIPDSANLSISVSDADLPVYPEINHNPISYFLTSNSLPQIKGSDSYLLTGIDKNTDEIMDLLMLTSYHERISTEDILKGSMPPISYAPEPGLSVNGFINSSYRTKDYVSNKINAIIKAEDSTTIYADVPIAKNGQFNIGNLDFLKTAKLYVRQLKDVSAAIDLIPSYIDTLTNAVLTQRTLFYSLSKDTTFIKTEISEKFQYKKRRPDELDEIIVTGRKKSKEELLTDEYASDQFKQSEYTYVLDSNIVYFSVWQFLQANVPGLNVGTGLDPVVNFNRNTGIRDASTGSDLTFVEDMNGGKSSIAFFLNEILVPIETISDLQPKDIALIKVNRNPKIGLNAMHGSIFLYTRKGSYSSGGFHQKKINGYMQQGIFYSPVYNTPESRMTSDYRPTLLWLDHVKSENQNTTIHFYNNDVSKRFRIVVCGLTKEGYPVYMEKIIE